ncbi:MAG: diguanylate cyclase domain-containing protein [bacterium]
MPRKYFFIFEALVGYAILVAIDVVFLKDSTVYRQIHPHPYWIVILLIASRYGTGAGIFAGAIAAMAYIGIGSSSGSVDFSHDVFPRGAFKYPFLFLLIGWVLGEIRGLYKKKYARLEEKHQELSKNFQDLELMHTTVTHSKQELEKRIAFQTTTMLDLLERLNKMELLKIEQIYAKSLELLEEHLRVTCSSIYLIDHNRLKLQIRRGDSLRSVLPEEAEFTHGMMGQVITSKKAVCINEVNFEDNPEAWDKSDLIMSAPISRKDGAVLGVINVESIPFFDFTANTMQVFEMLCHLISTVVDKAIQFNSLKDRNVADEITGAYNYLYFQKRLAYEVARAKRFNTALSLVLLQIRKFGKMAEAERRNVLLVLHGLFNNVLRQTDIIFKYRQEDTFAIIFPCQISAKAETIMTRLMNEIDKYGLKPFSDRDEKLSLKYGLSSLQISEGSYESLVKTAEERLYLSGQRRAADLFSDIKYLLGPDEDEREEPTSEILL